MFCLTLTEVTESTKPVDSESEGSRSATTEEEVNDKKMAALGLNLDTFNHLPAKQRELFLRIQHQQALNDGEDEQKVTKEGEENRDSQTDEDAEKEPAEKGIKLQIYKFMLT